MARLPSPPAPGSVGLPPRPFLYTIDQIAQIISVVPSTVSRSYLFYEGRNTGSRPRDRMLARNIAPDSIKTPEWRVAEGELVRWMKVKNFRYHERGWLES